MADNFPQARRALSELIFKGASDEMLATVLRDLVNIVVLTQAQYDALAVKEPNTIYITTST